LKEKRDRALLAVLLACGLRRHEAVELNFSHIQQREEHRANVDLKGKAGHISTIPMPAWVVREYDKKAGIDKLAPHDLRRTCARLCHA